MVREELVRRARLELALERDLKPLPLPLGYRRVPVPRLELGLWRV